MRKGPLDRSSGLQTGPLSFCSKHPLIPASNSHKTHTHTQNPEAQGQREPGDWSIWMSLVGPELGRDGEHGSGAANRSEPSRSPPSWGCGNLCDTPALLSCHSDPGSHISSWQHHQDGRTFLEPHQPCIEPPSPSHSSAWSDYYSQKQNKIKQ